MNSLLVVVFSYLSITIVYIFYKFKNSRLLSLVPLLLFILNSALIISFIFLQNKSHEDFEIEDKFFNTKVTLVDFNSFDVNSFKSEKRIFYTHSITENVDLYTLDKKDGLISILFPFNVSNFDSTSNDIDFLLNGSTCIIKIKKVDNEFKGFYSIIDEGAPDVICGDTKIISSWPKKLAFEYENINIDNIKYLHKPLKEIKVDFSKNLNDLEFFKSIRFIEK